MTAAEQHAPRVMTAEELHRRRRQSSLRLLGFVICWLTVTWSFWSGSGLRFLLLALALFLMAFWCGQMLADSGDIGLSRRVLFWALSITLVAVGWMVGLMALFSLWWGP